MSVFILSLFEALKVLSINFKMKWYCIYKTKKGSVTVNTCFFYNTYPVYYSKKITTVSKLQMQLKRRLYQLFWLPYAISLHYALSNNEVSDIKQSCCPELTKISVFNSYFDIQKVTWAWLAHPEKKK